MRKEPLVVGQVYHVFTKSIAGFSIFNNDDDFLRIISVIRYYQRRKPVLRFSEFIELPEIRGREFNMGISVYGHGKLVEIIAYCIMPTHLHLILKELQENGVSNFMRRVLDSYTRYFNIKYKRKGPLWEGKFKNALVKTDEQLLHLTRYLHLNPVTAHLVDKPEDWTISSYREYLSMVNTTDRICDYSAILDVKPIAYREFVEERIPYQRALAEIKELLLE